MSSIAPTGNNVKHRAAWDTEVAKAAERTRIDDWDDYANACEALANIPGAYLIRMGGDDDKKPIEKTGYKHSYPHQPWYLAGYARRGHKLAFYPGSVGWACWDVDKGDWRPLAERYNPAVILQSGKVGRAHLYWRDSERRGGHGSHKDYWWDETAGDFRSVSCYVVLHEAPWALVEAIKANAGPLFPIDDFPHALTTPAYLWQPGEGKGKRTRQELSDRGMSFYTDDEGRRWIINPYLPEPIPLDCTVEELCGYAAQWGVDGSFNTVLYALCRNLAWTEARRGHRHGQDLVDYLMGEFETILRSMRDYRVENDARDLATMVSAASMILTDEGRAKGRQEQSANARANAAIAAQRKRDGLTIVAIAAEMGVNRNTVSKWLRDENARSVSICGSDAYGSSAGDAEVSPPADLPESVEDMAASTPETPEANDIVESTANPPPTPSETPRGKQKGNRRKTKPARKPTAKEKAEAADKRNRESASGQRLDRQFRFFETMQERG